MKLLVFAHVPPPHHGQSQMVQYLVAGLREQPTLGVEVFHVDARLSADLSDVGSARSGKIFQLLGYCARALWIRWRHGLRAWYYIPSPPKRNSLYRDWIVLLLLRPWFREVIFHWHSVGLGTWLEQCARPWERWLTLHLLGGASLAICLSESGRADAGRLHPRRVEVVNNGTPDPCPRFAVELADLRRQRLRDRQDGNIEVRVLFLALCTRDKGLFDALEAIAIANEAESKHERPRRFRLTVAGSFPEATVETEFRTRCARPDLQPWVDYAGFLRNEAKEAVWRAIDLFLFPTFFANEGQPVSLIEAMAFGVPVVTTRWRGIPDMFPSGYPGLVEPHQPEAAAAALRKLAVTEDGLALRTQYEARFSVSRHLEAMAAAFRSTEMAEPQRSGQIR